jgi:hypothetical protein
MGSAQATNGDDPPMQRPGMITYEVNQDIERKTHRSEFFSAGDVTDDLSGSRMFSSLHLGCTG